MVILVKGHIDVVAESLFLRADEKADNKDQQA